MNGNSERVLGIVLALLTLPAPPSSGGPCTGKSSEPCPKEGTSCHSVGGTAIACCIDGEYEQRVDPATNDLVVACQCEMPPAVVVSCPQ